MYCLFPLLLGEVKELKKMEEELNKYSEDRIKIIEKGGVKIENMLSKKDPFKKESCKEKWCPICKNTPNKIEVLCNTNNVGYRWTCKTCESKNKVKVYEGETSRSARLRGKEHLSALNGKRADSFLYKHKTLEHEEEEMEVSMEITGLFKDALSRQADEAVRIKSRNNDELMNSKSEFNHPPIARIVVEKKSKAYFNSARAKLSPGL